MRSFTAEGTSISSITFDSTQLPSGELRDELPLLQAPDHLEDEERDAVRLQGDPAAELLRQPFAPERVLQQEDHVPRAEAGEAAAPEALEPAEVRRARPRAGRGAS